MILFLLAAVALAPSQETIATARKAFVACLHTAADEAAAAKVAPDAIEAMMRPKCQAQISAFQSAMVGFDVKNGVARKQATSDAEAQIADYFVTAKENYAIRAGH